MMRTTFDVNAIMPPESGKKHNAMRRPIETHQPRLCNATEQPTEEF
jgi:hypothetical protein